MLTRGIHPVSRRFALPMLLMLAVAGFANAGIIDLSSGNSFTLGSGQTMVLRFSVWNYAFNNRGGSPYPTSVALELAGANPASSLTQVPGSNSQYYSGYLLQGTIESLDGTASAPLLSPAAQLLGLGPGSLVLTPGMFYSNGAASPAATIDADAAFSLSLSEQIFGPDIASRQSSALIVLRNLGSDLVIGMGSGQSLRSAITEPSVTGPGGIQTAGITQALSVVDVPEPGTLLLLGMLVLPLGGTLLLSRLRRAR